MHARWFGAMALVVGLTALMSGCGGSTTSSQPRVPTSSSPPSPLAIIGVTGTAPAVGSSRSFAAAASYFDGSVYLVTAQATWTSSDTAIATVSSAGLVTGLAVGSTTITATYKGVSGTKVITVNLVAEF